MYVCPTSCIVIRCHDVFIFIIINYYAFLVPSMCRVFSLTFDVPNILFVTALNIICCVPNVYWKVDYHYVCQSGEVSRTNFLDYAR